jgi:phosphoglycolate phosphatase-like HAD superfamily hydrolase
VRAGARAGCTVAAYTGTFPPDLLRAAGAAFTFDAFNDLAARIGL